MKKLLLTALISLAALFGGEARAQQSGCQYIIYGAVLTVGQWQSCFQNKQDALGYVPANSANGVFTGRTVFAPPTTNASSVNFPPGTGPASPVAGDAWATSSGLFYFNGTTVVGPLAGAGTNTFTGAQLIDLGTGAQPAANLGGAWEAYGASGNPTRFEVTTFANVGIFDARASLGTRTSPSTVTNGTQLGSFEGKGFDGSVWTGTGAAFHPFAEGTWSTGSHPGMGCIATTASGATVTSEYFCVHQDGGATLGTSATDQGVGTLNIGGGGSLYNNGTAPTGTGAYVRANTPTMALTSLNCVNGSVVLNGSNQMVTMPCAPVNNAIGADVLLNATSTYFDGPSIAQGSGVTGATWWVSGQVDLTDTAGAAVFVCRLWDGTTIITSGKTQITAANQVEQLSLSGWLTNPAANIKISCKDTSSTSGKMLFNTTGDSKDSNVAAFRVQ